MKHLIKLNAMAFIAAMCSLSLVACDDDDAPNNELDMYKGHEYVDLGLTSGTLWATCNVGADAPESYGAYYAWGEVTTHYSAGGNTDNPTWKDGYSAGYEWSTYKWCNGSDDTQTKYCTSSSCGTVDNKTELDDADDVAVQTWGGAWKMPTHKQQEELSDECYWVWTTSYNGKSVSGYIVYKAKNDSDKGVRVYSGSTPSADYDVASDAHIFLPAAGVRWNTKLHGVGDIGIYWSRSLCPFSSDYPDVSAYAEFLEFQPECEDRWGIKGYRDGGFSVRPVCPGVQK